MYILTFSKPSPPEKLRIGYLSVHMDLFIPNLLSCFKCQRYGHGRDSCKNLPACFRCGQQGHDSTDCQRATKCVNCQGDHVAASKDCPVWKKRNTNTKGKNRKSSRLPAWRHAGWRHATPSPGAKTYAAGSRVSTKTVDCQTDITWLSRERPLAMNSGKSQTPVSTHHLTDTQTIHSLAQTSVPTSAPAQTTESESQCPARQASARGRCRIGSQSKPKKKPQADRLPKSSSDLIFFFFFFFFWPFKAVYFQMWFYNSFFFFR